MDSPWAAMERAATCMTHGGQLAGDLVHVGDHQQQALGRGEGGGQAAALQGSVERSGGAAFALHFDDFGNGSPDVGFAFGGPLIAELAHRGGRSNGIDSNNFVGLMRDVGGGFVAVDGHLNSSHEPVLQIIYKGGAKVAAALAETPFRDNATRLNPSQSFDYGETPLGCDLSHKWTIFCGSVTSGSWRA